MRLNINSNGNGLMKMNETTNEAEKNEIQLMSWIHEFGEMAGQMGMKSESLSV